VADFAIGVFAKQKRHLSGCAGQHKPSAIHGASFVADFGGGDDEQI
jgi:hypothetical protein